MLYGSLEFAYAEPFANALQADPTFRAWVLHQTKFAPVADQARLLADAMMAKRGRSSATWWRSHYTEKCRCQGCSGQETDILAVFEASGPFRFAVHFEVKQPTDRFPAHKDQGANYALRAACWVRSAPKAVVQHADATTVLLCSASKLTEYTPHLSAFGTVLTFEEVAGPFPNAVPSSFAPAQSLDRGFKTSDVKSWEATSQDGRCASSERRDAGRQGGRTITAL